MVFIDGMGCTTVVTKNYDSDGLSLFCFKNQKMNTNDAAAQDQSGDLSNVTTATPQHREAPAMFNYCIYTKLDVSHSKLQVLPSHD